MADPVTLIASGRVHAGMGKALAGWHARQADALSGQSGFLSTDLLAPRSGARSALWTIRITFASAEQLDAWQSSAKCRDLLAESKQFMEREELIRITGSFPGWVPVDPVSGQAPPNWKTAMLVLLGLYPIVMLELRLLSPFLSDLGIQGALGTFIGNSISVTLTSFLTMPWFVQAFNWWLFPGIASPRALTRRGLQIIGLLYVLEVAVLWELLPFLASTRFLAFPRLMDLTSLQHH